MEELIQHRRMGETQVAVAELSRRLRAARLTPAQRAVARFILANPARFVFMSGAELAADVGVSQPSVTRLAQELGYRGYGEMTSEIRDLLGSGSVDDDDSGDNAYQQLIDAEIASLRDVRTALADATGLERAAEMIMSAHAVAVLGLRISAPLAQHFHYRLNRLRGGVTLTTAGGSVSLDDLALASQGGSAVAVVFAMPRYPAEIAPALKFARDRDVRVVLFVDTPAAPICAATDHLIVAPVTSGVTFGSLTAAYLLSSLVIDRVASLSADASGRRLIDLEALALASGHYLDDRAVPSPADGPARG